MKRIGWFSLVFLVSVLAGLPANWLLAPMAAQGVSGSLWQGQAQRLGQVGPLAWHWQPWRLQAQVNLGFQGQDWQLKVAGWPWNWTAAVEPLQRTLAMPLSYRLTGEWTGRIEVQGSGRQCQGSQGEIAGHNLALVAPWSVPLGATRVRLIARSACTCWRNCSCRGSISSNWTPTCASAAGVCKALSNPAQPWPRCCSAPSGSSPMIRG